MGIPYIYDMVLALEENHKLQAESLLICCDYTFECHDIEVLKENIDEIKKYGEGTIEFHTDADEERYTRAALSKLLGIEIGRANYSYIAHEIKQKRKRAKRVYIKVVVD